jgi:hypothetical protein
MKIKPSYIALLAVGVVLTALIKVAYSSAQRIKSITILTPDLESEEPEK